MMLDHAGRDGLATRLRTALDQVLTEDNMRTRDLGGTASTKDFTAAVVRRLG